MTNKDRDFMCPERPNSAGRFIEACLLCLLKEKESYGYNLLEELQNFHSTEAPINMSVIYRNLRGMEKKNLVSSRWAESDLGPKKRIYQITAQGEQTLADWILFLKNRAKRIASIIEKYESLR